MSTAAGLIPISSRSQGARLPAAVPRRSGTSLGGEGVGFIQGAEELRHDPPAGAPDDGATDLVVGQGDGYVEARHLAAVAVAPVTQLGEGNLEDLLDLEWLGLENRVGVDQVPAERADHEVAHEGVERAKWPPHDDAAGGGAQLL